MIEICCGSYEDAVIAYNAGAKRIELNSALYLGGLTPSIASLKLVKKNTNLEVISMLRSRAAGFAYSELEFDQMYEEAKELIANGSDGIAFGALKDDGSFDFDKVNKIYELCKKNKITYVLHRAYDCVKNWEEVLEFLKKLRNVRILTSGREANAYLGKEHIKYLQENYSDYIEILAGSGVNSSNVKEIIDYTGVKQIHSSCKDYVLDPTTTNGKVTYSYIDDKNIFEQVNSDKVKELIALGI